MSRTNTGVVTGASGFIGQYLVRDLMDAGWCVVPVALADRTARSLDVEGALLAGLQESNALPAGAVVFHLAGLGAGDDESSLVEANCTVALEAYRAAARAGAASFVYLSSSRVFGATAGRVDEKAKVVPDDAYGRSKALAETELLAAAVSGTRLVIVRAPPVYGAGCRGNLVRFMRAVADGWPLPFGAVNERRSYVSATNLASAMRWLGNPANGLADGPLEPASIWHVADCELSPREICESFANALGERARLIRVPNALLSLVARTTLGSRQRRALLEPLCLDTRCLEATGWIPPQPIAVGIEDMAKWFRTQSSR